MKQHKHCWVRVSNEPWLRTYGNEVMLECSICHRFTHVNEDDIEKLINGYF